MSVLNSATTLSDLNYDAKLTTNATTTVSSRNTYITAISLTVTTAGTATTLTIQDAQATPVVLVNALTTTATNTAPTIYSFGSQGIFMNNGVSIVTAGTTAATVTAKIQ